MNIDQQIYHELLKNAGGEIKNIKDISRPTLIEMRRGESRTSFRKLIDVLLANGMECITLKSQHTEMQINSLNGEVTVTTKSLSK